MKWTKPLIDIEGYRALKEERDHLLGMNDSLTEHLEAARAEAIRAKHDLENAVLQIAGERLKEAERLLRRWQTGGDRLSIDRDTARFLVSRRFPWETDER